MLTSSLALSESGSSLSCIREEYSSCCRSPYSTKMPYFKATASLIVDTDATSMALCLGAQILRKSLRCLPMPLFWLLRLLCFFFMQCIMTLSYSSEASGLGHYLLLKCLCCLQRLGSGLCFGLLLKRSALVDPGRDIVYVVSSLAQRLDLAQLLILKTLLPLPTLPALLETNVSAQRLGFSPSRIMPYCAPCSHRHLYESMHVS